MLGIAFLLQAVTSLVSGLILKLGLIVPGDIGRSMVNVAANPWLLQAHILGEMITAAGVIFLGAVLYTVLLFLAGMADNVLKPLMLGRGVDAPMPVILLGALGGMVAAGILGMFVGATLLALGYQIFMSWVTDNPDAAPAEPEEKSQSAS